ncbi:MAG: hypothetical protein KDC80_26410 [Saprospiraceae bacterium]|nr:hypothetical protein [Saprospiraceae bacterium]
MKSSTSLALLLVMATFVSVSAQRSQRRQSFDPAEVRKMPIVLIDMVDKSYPRVHLQKVTDASLTVIKRTLHDHTLKPMYFSGTVALDEIESIVLISKKRRFRTNAIGAVVGGALGYFVGRQFRPDPIRQANLELASQRPVNGFIEPILGGIVGFGLGAVVGDLFTPIYIDNVSRNQKQAISTLKDYAPNRRSKKSRKRKRR